MGFCYHMCPLLGNPFFIHGYVPSFILYGSGPCVFFFSLHIFSLTYCMCILFSSVYILLCRNTLLIHRFVLYVFFLWQFIPHSQIWFPLLLVMFPSLIGPIGSCFLTQYFNLFFFFFIIFGDLFSLKFFLFWCFPFFLLLSIY